MHIYEGLEEKTFFIWVPQNEKNQQKSLKDHRSKKWRQIECGKSCPIGSQILLKDLSFSIFTAVEKQCNVLDSLVYGPIFFT